MKRHIYPILLVAVVCIVGATALWKTYSQPAMPVAVGTVSVATRAGGISSAEVATHNSGASCWTSISGSVYDLTAWITRHPGGRGAILRLCGVDGTAAFQAQHGGQGRPERELATFKIGTLAR